MRSEDVTLLHSPGSHFENKKKLLFFIVLLRDLTPHLCLFEQLCRQLLQALPPDPHRVESNQDDTNEAGHGEE